MTGIAYLTKDGSPVYVVSDDGAGTSLVATFASVSEVPSTGLSDKALSAAEVADLSKVTVDQTRYTTDSSVLAADQAAITADQAALTADQAALAADAGTVYPAPGTIANPIGTVTSTGTVIPPTAPLV